MRRQLTTLVTALAIGMSAVTIAPVQAAPRMASDITDASSAIELVGGRGDEWRRGDRHNRRDRHRNRHRHRHFDIHPGFFFPFQFYQGPRYYQAPRRDCYRGWDGRLYCAR